MAWFFWFVAIHVTIRRNLANSLELVAVHVGGLLRMCTHYPSWFLVRDSFCFPSDIPGLTGFTAWENRTRNALVLQNLCPLLPKEATSIDRLAFSGRIRQLSKCYLDHVCHAMGKSCNSRKRVCEKEKCPKCIYQLFRRPRCRTSLLSRLIARDGEEND